MSAVILGINSRLSRGATGESDLPSLSEELGLPLESLQGGIDISQVEGVIQYPFDLWQEN